MFENLSEKLDRALQVIKGDHKISEIKIAETAKEIRRVLVDADVNYKIAKEFTDRVKEKAIGARVHTSLNPKQVFIKIVKDELTELMGGGAKDINIEGKPAVILIAGLQGSGKTTFSGKLALHLKTKKNRRVLLAAGDVYRPAAIDQLKVLGEGIGGRRGDDGRDIARTCGRTPVGNFVRGGLDDRTGRSEHCKGI